MNFFKYEYKLESSFFLKKGTHLVPTIFFYILLKKLLSAMSKAALWISKYRDIKNFNDINNNENLLEIILLCLFLSAKSCNFGKFLKSYWYLWNSITLLLIHHVNQIQNQIMFVALQKLIAFLPIRNMNKEHQNYITSLQLRWYICTSTDLIVECLKKEKCVFCSRPFVSESI